MNEERDRDSKEVDKLLKEFVPEDGNLENMPIEDKIEILRGVCAFLLLEVQKLYMFIARNSSTLYDNVLHNSMGNNLIQSDDILNTCFQDYLVPREDDDEPDDSE